MGSYNALKETSSAFANGSGSAGKWVRGPVGTFVMGAMAGTVTAFVTQPFDKVKTRVQSARGVSTGEALRSVLVDEGVKGLWRGSGMRVRAVGVEVGDCVFCL
jgi:solute carrier family 25 (mitochondrial citrate transporter), member 1